MDLRCSLTVLCYNIAFTDGNEPTNPSKAKPGRRKELDLDTLLASKPSLPPAHRSHRWPHSGICGAAHRRPSERLLVARQGRWFRYEAGRTYALCLQRVTVTETTAYGLAKGSMKTQGISRSSVVHVCTSCRLRGSGREPRENRLGFKLYRELRTRFHESPLGQRVEVRPVECLSLCPRPCGIVLTSPGAWCYLFGDQQPGESADDILECVSLYMGSKDGFMPREQRPKRLRASVLGRVPPYGEGR